MTTAPAFRQIPTPLDVPDAALDQINRRKGVPTLVTTPPQPETPPLPHPASPAKAINIHLPDYVVKALKDKAHVTESSVRYVIMMALAASGIAIKPDDLVQDARRNR